MSVTVLRLPRKLIVAAAFVIGVASTSAYSDPAQVAQLKKTKQCSDCDLSGADLRGQDLRAADLTGANLNGALLYKANLAAATLDRSDLRGADLRGTNLRGATGALLSGAKTDATTICPAGTAGPCQ